MLLAAVLFQSTVAQNRIIKVDKGRNYGVKPQTDSLFMSDSLMLNKLDSMLVMADSLKVDTAMLNTTRELRSKIARRDSVSRALSTPIKVEKRRFNFTRDTISPKYFTYMSLVPGLGQIYNRQWWKVPVIYAAVGGFAAGGLIQSQSFNSYKAEWQKTVNLGLPIELQNQAKVKMQRAGSTRTIMYSMAALTYLYSVADATFNYRGRFDPIRRSTTLALVFPGAGFFYTRTYWRIPIYYGGFAVLGTVVDYNNRNFQRYNTAYKYLTDGDPTTVDEFNGRFKADVLKNVKNSYRRNRDLGIIALVAAYALSVVDAHVIATLKNWDVSPELSMRVEPTIIDTRIQRASVAPQGYGLSLKVSF